MSVLALAAMSATASSAFAVSAISLDFNGAGNDLAATGFESVYSLVPAGFSVGGGRLTISTLEGDTFGDFENDPDSAKNMFYSAIDAFDQTTVEARVRVTGLNQNFHGGGIWMGTDQDHLIRLALFNNTFEGGIAVEALRENQDLWPGNVPPGPGGDIVGRAIGGIATSPQVTPIDVVLRLIRNGSTASAFASFDNGVSFQQVGGAGFTFDNIVTGPGQGFGGGTSIEGGFKVGVYALGGGANPASFAFDSFTATSVPEPTTAALLAIGATLLMRRRK